ncbi:hypothetical protein MXB_2039, partial [Myxobolus squamalis]
MALKTLREIININRDVVVSMKFYYEINIGMIFLRYYARVNKTNLKSIVSLMSNLIKHSSKTSEIDEGKVNPFIQEFVDKIIEQIIQISSHDNYSYVSNFEWFIKHEYVDVMLDLVVVSMGSIKNKSGSLIASEFLCISLR